MVRSQDEGIKAAQQNVQLTLEMTSANVLWLGDARPLNSIPLTHFISVVE